MQTCSLRLDSRIAASIAVGCLLAATGGSARAAEGGKDVFRARCIGCHAMGCNRSGPKLAGILGRRVGSVADFSGYTNQLKSAGFVWSRGLLDKFLADPDAMVPGTQMSSAGRLDRAADRKMVIDFIASGDTSLDLCF